MAKVTNLSRFRKDKARRDKRAAGDANAAKFGRSKAETERARAEADKAARELDGKKRE